MLWAVGSSAHWLSPFVVFVVSSDSFGFGVVGVLTADRFSSGGASEMGATMERVAVSQSNKHVLAICLATSLRLRDLRSCAKRGGTIIRTSWNFRKEWNHMPRIQWVIGAVLEASTLLVFPIFGIQNISCLQRFPPLLLRISLCLPGSPFVLRFAHLFDDFLHETSVRLGV
jgi:hypothetical protein